MTPTIVHCVSAYPDPIAPETQASSLLLALTAERLNHYVFSFKRATWRGPITAINFDDAAGTGHRAMVYGAAPKGLHLARRMGELADWIIADTEARGLSPDLVHAHKVSMDGLVGQRVAAHFNVPLVLTVQANTDTRIIGSRRDLRDIYSALWQKAAVVFPFAPNAVDAMNDLLGPRRGMVQILPCPTPADTITAPRLLDEDEAPRIVTAFNLAHYENKNIKTLLQAVARAAVEVPDITLDIIGGGDAAAFMAVAQMAEAIAPGRVRLLGARQGAEMQAHLHEATAFAMVSHRESFGMVFSEALLAGTPCLHSADRAIDRLFPDGEITLGVTPTDVAAMAQALVHLCHEEAAFKARLAEAQMAGRLEPLRRNHIAAIYADTVEHVLRRRTDAT